MTIEAAVPISKSRNRIFINDGVHCFSRMDNPNTAYFASASTANTGPTVPTCVLFARARRWAKRHGAKPSETVGLHSAAEQPDKDRGGRELKG